MKRTSPLLQAMRRRLVVPVNTLMIACFAVWSVEVSAGDATWNQTAAGTYGWVVDGNWTPAEHPNAIGSAARFTQVTGDHQVVEVDEQITLGRLSLGTYGGINNHVFQAVGSGSLVFDNAVVGGVAYLDRTGRGYDIINAPVSLVDVLVANIGSTGSLINAINTAGVYDFSTVRINGDISGSFASTVNAITKQGRGNLILAGDNSYTGRTLINQGALTILHANALGGDGVIVSGNGAQLRIGGGITTNENITVGSQGSNVRQNSDGGLVSVGNNRLTGLVNLSANSRVYSNIGMLEINNMALDVRQLIFNTGGSGNGNVRVVGTVTGAAASEMVKESGGTLIWNPADASGFSGFFRVNGGVVRIDSAADTGTRTGIDAIRFNNATLEVRSDSLTADTGFASKGVTVDNNATQGIIFVDRAVGGTGVKQVLTLGDLQMNNRDITTTGRNGYSVTFVDSADADTWVARMTETRTFTNNLNGILTFQGDFLMDSTGTAKTVTAAVNNGNVLLTGNFIQTSGTTVGHSFVKTGNATFIIQGTNSQWTGTTSINGGVVEVSSLAGLPSGLINIGTGTTAAASTSAPALRYVGSGGSFSNVINLAGTTGNGRIDASGSGALVLAGNITATGAGAKSLVLGGTNTGANTISGTIVDNSVTNTTGLIKVGAGTWVLSGNNAYTGLTQIMNGILRVDATGTGGLAATGLTFSGVATGENTILSPGQTAGGRFEYTGNVAGTTESLGALTFSAGDGTVVLNRSGGVTSLSFSSLSGRTAGATGNFVTSGGVNGAEVAIRLGSGVTNATIINSGMYFGGADFAAYDTSSGGFVRALAYGSDVGTSVLDTIGAATHVKLTTASPSQASISLLTLNLSGSGTDFTMNSSSVLTLSTGGLLKSGGGASVIGGGAGASMTTGGATELIVRVDLSGESLTINLPITGSTGGLTKSGEGTLVLGGANTYTGTTTVNDGLVQLTGAGTLGATGNALMVRQKGTIDLNGLNLGVGAFGGSGMVTNSSGTSAIFTIGNSNGAGIFTGGISGNLGVTKTGTGAIRVTGANTYTGSTTINGGTLEVFSLADGGVASGIGQSSNAAANLVLSGGASLSYFGETTTTNRLFTLGTTGGRINSQTGAFLLGGTTTYQGALIFANTGALAFAGTGNRLLTLGGNSQGDNEIRLLIGDNGLERTSVTKVDGGLWILGNTANSFTGATTITGGILRAIDGQSLPNDSNLVLNGGVLETDGTFIRGIGTGAGQFNWATNASGGFSAWRDKLVVNINTDGDVDTIDTLVWGTGGIGNGTGSLILNSATANFEVEFKNHIDLGSVQRTVTVNNNGLHTLDYAILSGNISGTGILAKNGSGLLLLTGANTFSGNLWIQDGQVAADSIGSSAGAVYATNVGTAGGGGSLASIRIGNGGTAGTFIYTGSGEVTDRVFDMFGSTGGAVIEASGTGALVITSNLAVTTNGIKTLTLQGSTFDANEFRGVIGDSGSGATSFTKGGVGSWILSGANTFTGNVTFNSNAGTLILGHAQALGLGTKTLSFNDQTVLGALVDFTFGSNMTINQPGNVLRITGNKNFTFNSAFNITRTGDNMTYENFLEYGAVATFNGTITFSGDTTARTFTLSGNGTTYLNGLIQDTAGGLDTFNVGGGIVVLGGGSANTFGGNTLLNGSTTFLRMARGGDTNPLGTTGILQMDAGFFEAGVNLSGAAAMKNQLRMNGTAAVVGANDVDFTQLTTNNGGDRRLNTNLAAGNRLLLTNVNLSNDGTNRTFTIGGLGATLINGQIVNGGGSTTSAFTYNGLITGSLTIGNGATANAYAGATILSGGTTILTNTSADQFGTGTLQLNGSAQGGWLQSQTGSGSTIDNATLLNGSGSFFVNGSQNVTFTGTVTNNGGNRILNSDITGGGVLGFSGTVNLSNDNTGRTLTIGGGGNAVFNSTGVIANGGTAAGAFIKAGAGTVTMIADNTYTGTTTVLGGELVLNYSSVTGTKLSSSAALTLGSNAFPTASTFADSNNSLANPTLRLQGHASSNVTETVSGLTVNQGGARIIVSSAGGSLVLAVGALTRTQPGSTLDVAVSGAGANMTTSSVLTNGILGGYLTWNGTDFAGLSGSNLAAAAYTTNNAVNTWVAGGNLSNSAAYSGTLAANLAINSLRFGFAGNSTVTLGSDVFLTVSSGGILVSSGVGNNASTITGGYLDGGSAAELIFHQHNTANQLTVASAILDTNRVVKSGDGTLLLSGANTYYGDTIINEGMILAQGGAAIGDYSTVILRNDATAGLQIAADEVIGSLQGGGAVGGNVQIGTNNLTINQLLTTSYGGAITGSGDVMIQGVGHLRLYGSSSGFTGDVFLSGGQSGMIQLLGDGVENMRNANSFTIKDGSILVDHNGSRPTDRIGNSAAVNLVNAKGSFGGVVSGLWVRTDQFTQAYNWNQGANTADYTNLISEDIGVLSLSGDNYARLESTGGGVLQVIADSLNRNDGATLNVRGTNLGQGPNVGITTQRALFSFTSAPTANLLGGGGAANTTTVSVLPWAIGQSVTGALGVNDRGNSFLTFDSTTQSLRPLNLTTEYATTFEGLTHNVRFASTASATQATPGGNARANVLVLDSSAGGSLDILGNGTGSLTLNAGAVLSTSQGGTAGTSIGGFTEILTNAPEYVFFTQGNHTLTVNAGLNTVTAGLVKSGEGRLVLTAANGSAGVVYVNSGVLQLDNTLASSGVVINGGSLISNFAEALADSATVTLTDASASYVLNQSDTIDSVSSVAGARVNIAGPATLTILSNLNALLSGTGSFAKGGAGTMVFGPGHSYTGGTIIKAGTLQLDGAVAGLGKIYDFSAVTVMGGAFLDLNGVSETIGSLSGAGNVLMGSASLVLGADNSNVVFSGGINGTGNVTKVGSGVQVFSGENTFSGVLTILGGTVALDHAGDNALPNNMRVVLDRGGRLDVRSNESVGQITAARNSTVNIADTGEVLVINYNTAGPVTHVLDNNFTGQGGVTIANTGAGAGASQVTLNLGGFSTQQGAMTISSTAASATDFVVNVGTASLPYRHLSSEALLDLQAAANNTLVVNIGPSSPINFSSFEKVGGLASSTTGTVRINLVNGSNVASFAVGGNNQNTTFHGAFVGDNGQAAILKTGTGVFTITNSTITNKNDGVWRVDNGTLALAGSGNDRLDSATVVVLGNKGGGTGATFDITNGTETISAIRGGGRATGLTGVGATNNTDVSLGGNEIGGTGGNVNLTAGTTMTINAGSGTNVFGGVFTGTGTFQKQGGSALLLLAEGTSAMTYTANAGTTRLHFANRSVAFGDLATADVRGGLADAATLNMTGGTFETSGLNESIATLTGSSGTVNLGTSSNIFGAGTGRLTINNASTTTFAATISQTTGGLFNAALSGAYHIGGLVKNGAGNVTLTAANTFTGDLLINQGILTLNNGSATGALADTVRVTVASGATLALSTNEAIGSLSGAGNVNLAASGERTLVLADNGNTTFSGVLSGTGSSGLTLLGGSLTLTASQTYQGVTTLQNGATLVFNGADILSDTASNGSGGTLLLGGGTLVLAAGVSGTELRGDDTDLAAGANTVFRHRDTAGVIQLRNINRLANTGATLNVYEGAATTNLLNTSAGILGGWAVADGTSWAVNATGGADGAIIGLDELMYTPDSFGGSDSHLDVTSDFDGTGLANTIRFNANAATTLTNTSFVLLQSGGILVTENVGAHTSSIVGGSILVADNEYDELILHQHNRHGAFVLGSTILDSTNPIGLTKVGRGTAVLTADNANTGVTRVLEGRLIVGAGGSSGSISTAGVVLQGILEFNRSGTTQLNQSIDSRVSGAFLNSSVPQYSLGWLIQNHAGGTLALAGNNSNFTGRISVLQGVLEAQANNSLGAASATAGGVFVEQGATVRLSATSAITTAANKVLVLEGGTLEARGANHVYNGVLQLAKDSTVDVGSGLSFTFSGTNDNAIFGLLESDHSRADLSFQGGGGLTHLLQGALFANAWEDTTIGAGHTVRLGNNNNLGSLGYGQIINNGVLEFYRNDTVLIIDNAITGSGDMSFNRVGTVLLTGGSTSTGNILVGNPSLERSLVQIGNFGFGDALNTASGNTVTVTSLNGSDSHFRFGTQTNLLNTDASFVLAVGTDPDGGGSLTAGRDAYLVKRGLGVVQINGTITTSGGGGGNLGTINVDSGNLRLTNGLGTALNPFAGEINMGGGVLEITGTADSYLGGSTGGLLQGTGAIFAYRSTGTLHITSGGHTYSNNRDNLAGLYIYNGVVNLNHSGGNAWANDGHIYIMNGGTLQINSTGGETVGFIGTMQGSSLVLNTNLTLNNGATINRTDFMAGTISGSGSLIKVGQNGTNNETSPSVVLANTANSFTGQLVIRVGGVEALTIGNIGQNSSLGAGDLIVLGDDGTATATSPQIRSFLALHNPTVNLSNRNFLITGSASHATGSIREIGAFGKQLILSGNVTNDSGTTARIFQLNGNSEANNTLSGNILQGAGTGAMTVRKEGAGRWILSGNNDFLGNLQINNGFLGVTSVAATGAGTNQIQLGSGTNSVTLEWMGTSAGTFAKTLNFTGTTGAARINANGTAGVTFNAVTITNNNNRTITLGGTSDPGVINTIAGNLTDTGSAAQSLAKDGRATWRLSGNNTIDGSITISSGILQVQNGQAIGDSRTVNVANNLVPFDENGNAVVAPATLELLSNETIGMLQGARGAVVNLNGNTLTINASATAQSFQGRITGTGGVILGSAGNANNFGLNNVENVASGLQGRDLYAAFLSDYTGSTTIVSAQLHTAYLANIGVASGIGRGNATDTASNAASLVLNGGSTNASNSGLLYQGTANVTNTDRLFQLGAAGTGTDATGIWNNAATVHGVSAGTLNFTNTNAIGFTGNAARTLTLRGTNISYNMFSPIIGDGAGGVTSLRKNDGGTWVLTAANTYNGVTTVVNGKLVLRHNQALGSTTGGTTVSGTFGAGIELQNNVVVTGETLTISGDGGSLGSGEGSSSIWAGNVIMNQNVRFYAKSGSTLEISGVVSSDNSSRAFAKYDTGTLILSGSNTYTGATSVLGGTLVLNYATNNNSKLADATSLTLGGTGIATLLTMAEYNNAATHQTWSQGGVLELAAGSHTEVVSATTINTGASRIVRSSGSSRINLNAITRNVGGTLDFGEAGIATTDTNNTNGILGGWATVGRNTWAVSTNSGAADTLINGLANGSYNVDSFGSGNNTDVVAFGAATTGFTTNSIRFNTAGGGTLSLSGTNNLQSGGILMTSASGAVTIGGGAGAVLRHSTVATAANSHDLVVHQHSANDLVIDVVVGENATGTNTQGLTKTGAGKVVLTQDNTFRGNINISEGTLQIGNGGNTGSLGTGGGTFNQVVMGDGATLILNTTKNTEYNFQTISGNGHIILASTNTQAFLLDDANTNWLGRITVDGGTLRVRSQNTAMGDQRSMVTVNSGGTLEAAGSTQTFNTRIVFNQGAILAARSAVVGSTLTNTNATISGKVELNNTTSAGMTVFVDSAQTLALSGVIQGSKGFTKTGNGTMVLSGNNWVDGVGTLLGQVVVSEGTLQLGGDGQQRNLGAVGAGNETLVLQGGRLNLNNADLNWADLAGNDREIIRISGTGLNSGSTAGTGALINTSGTANFTYLELAGDATVGGNSRIDMATTDVDASSLPSVIRPKLEGNGYELTKIGTNEFVFREAVFANVAALNAREGVLRIETNSPFIPIRNEIGTVVNPSFSSGAGSGALLAANVGVVRVNYVGSPTNDAASGAMNVMSLPRLDFYRQHGVVHTVPIDFGRGIISLSSDSLPFVYTTLAGTMTLSGAANGSESLFVIEGGGAGTNVEAGVYRNPFSALIVDADVTGAGGFTKLGSRELIFTKDTSFTGDAVINRFSNNDFYYDPEWGNQGAAQQIGVALAGAGTFNNATRVVLERGGVLRVVNNGSYNDKLGVVNTNNSDRLNDAGQVLMRNGYLIFDMGAQANTENMGHLVIGDATMAAGRTANYIDFDLESGANVTHNIGIQSVTRNAGSVLEFRVYDSNATFGGNTGDSVRIRLLDNGASIAPLLTGGTSGITRNVVQGMFGGIAMLPQDHPWRFAGTQDGLGQQRLMFWRAARDFMTTEVVDGVTYLRPLDDSEYAQNTMVAGANVNISEITYYQRDAITINSLRLGNLNDNLGNNATSHPGSRQVEVQDSSISLYLDDSAVLNITSGMVMGASWSEGGLVNGQQQFIWGGTLEFGNKEAIIHVVGGGYGTDFGGIRGDNRLEIRSTISGTGGLTKSGTTELRLDGRNTYSGLTTVTNGTVYLRTTEALGAGSTAAFDGSAGANGVVVNGWGQILVGNGSNIGSTTGREDIYVGMLNQGAVILRSDASVNSWTGNIVIDNVDNAGIALHTPQIQTNNQDTLILYGSIAGGNTAVLEDGSSAVLDANPRSLTFTSADGSNPDGWVLLKGAVGDRYVGGQAASIADTVSTLPTLAGVRTNENQVLTVNFNSSSNEAIYETYESWAAVGRLTMNRGWMRYMGTGDFYTAEAVAKMGMTSSTLPSGNVGFRLGNGADGGVGAFLLTKAGQGFATSGLLNWQQINNNSNGLTILGGENESGVVTFGNGAGRIDTERLIAFHASMGGEVAVKYQVHTGGSAGDFMSKIGRGTVRMLGSTLGGGNVNDVGIFGGTMIYDYRTNNVVMNDNTAILKLGGGTLHLIGNGSADTTQNFQRAAGTGSTSQNTFTIFSGGSQIVGEAVAGRTLNVNIGADAFGAAQPNRTITRNVGGTVNFVNTGGGTVNITLAGANVPRNVLLGWATFGSSIHSATDFAMVDATDAVANKVKAYNRTPGENINNVAAWGTNMDISENGGAGFSGMLAGNLTINSLHFDATADSLVNLGGNTLTLSGGGLMVSSEVGSFNKTITGGVLTTAAASSGGMVTNGELVIHHYGMGVLTIGASLGNANLTSVVINGVQTTINDVLGSSPTLVPGVVRLTAAGGNQQRAFYLNGGILEVSNENQLGLVDISSTANLLFLNGGTFRWTGAGTTILDEQRQIQVGGNGGVIDVANSDAVLGIQGEVFTDVNTTNLMTGAGNVYGGNDIIKKGAGTLLIQDLTDANVSFTGLLDIREGALRVSGARSNSGTGANSVILTNMFGTNRSWLDATVFRQGTRLEFRMGDLQTASHVYQFRESFRFEGGNLISVLRGGNNNHIIHLDGVIDLAGDVTVDVATGHTMRWNNDGGYVTGTGNLVKTGLGELQLRENSPDWTGGISLLQGKLLAGSQGKPLGSGTGAITLGSADHTGLAWLSVHNETGLPIGITIENDINVIYNPLQTKRLGLTLPAANGQDHYFTGDITMGDHLALYIEDSTMPTGGKFDWIHFNGQFKDDVANNRSGNLVLRFDNTAVDNDSNTGSGQSFGYFNFNNDNSAWTGDVVIATNTSYQYNETTILRLGHNNALTEKNEVTMNFNSRLQVAGNNVTIGGLVTQGGLGQPQGSTGSSEIVENAAGQEGTLTIRQTTPAEVEVLWDAYFQDGTTASHFVQPDSTTTTAAFNLVKDGLGWATLTLNNNYTGRTTVQEGILQVGRNGFGDTGADFNTKGMVVNSGATLAGTGIVQGSASAVHQIDGNLKPGDFGGDANGTLTFNGDTVFGNTATVYLQITRATFNAPEVMHIKDVAEVAAIPSVYATTLNDPVLVNQHDHIEINGSLTVDAGTRFVILDNGYNPVAGDVFNLIDWVGAALGVNTGGDTRSGGSIGALDLPTLGPDYRWDTSLFNSAGILVVTSVPEPGRMILLLLALFGLVARRRRHR